MDAEEDVMACWGRRKGACGEVVGSVEGVEDLSLHCGWERHGGGDDGRDIAEKGV